MSNVFTGDLQYAILYKHRPRWQRRLSWLVRRWRYAVVIDSYYCDPEAGRIKVDELDGRFTVEISGNRYTSGGASGNDR